MKKEQVIATLIYGVSAVIVLYVVLSLMELGHKWLWGY